ncbi:MAG: family transcriptional regulator, nitrogen oxide reductase regulator [Chloroflexota bacterium]|nr:family transcriptional regulator, nitrogen oxide reductase regulator [Chloroflexota bacterium]
MHPHRPIDSIAAEAIAAEAIAQTWPMASVQSAGRLVRAARVIEHAHGTVIPEAERPSRVAVVVQGTVAATWSAPDGRTVYAGLYGPGQFIGLGTLSGAPVTVGIDALTPVTIIVWRSGEFRNVVDSDPALALDFLDRGVYAIHALNRLIKLRTFTTAASRLAGLLLQYEAFCLSKEAPLLPRRHLAPMAGVTPQMVTRIFRTWEAAAVIRRVGTSGLELLDRSALEAEAAPLSEFPVPDPTIPGAWAAPVLEDHRS